MSDRDEFEEEQVFADPPEDANAPSGIPAAQIAEIIGSLRAERDRLAGWLAKIEGGDNPCTDERTLRQWAYEAITLGREAP